MFKCPLGEARHALEHLVQSRRHQVNHERKHGDEHECRDDTLIALEIHHPFRHLRDAAVWDEGREQHVPVGALVLRQRLRRDQKILCPLIELRPRKQLLRFVTGQDALLVGIHQRDRGTVRGNRPLGGDQKLLVDGHDDDQMAHRVATGILDPVADDQVRLIVDPGHQRAHVIAGADPLRGIGQHVVRQLQVAGLIDLAHSAARVDQQHVARRQQRVAAKEIRQPKRSEAFVDDRIDVLLWKPEQRLQILGQAPMVGEQARGSGIVGHVLVEPQQALARAQIEPCPQLLIEDASHGPALYLVEHHPDPKPATRPIMIAITGIGSRRSSRKIAGLTDSRGSFTKALKRLDRRSV